MEGAEPKKVTFGCCYCGGDVKEEDESPCQIVLITNWFAPQDEWQEQYWFAHEKCFREKLSKEANIDIPPAL